MDRYDNIPIPTESEWQIMEIVWARSESITSSDIVKEIQKFKGIAKPTIRVLVKRLVEKGLLDYTIDSHDSRVFHYTARYSREECRQAKSRDFVENYFKGSRTDAIAALVEKSELSDEEIMNLTAILDSMKRREEGV